MDAALRALNRFGLGARIGERRRLTEPREWLRAQLEGRPATIGAPADATVEMVGEAVRSLRAAGKDSPDDRRDARRRLVGIALAESRAAVSVRVTTEKPFLERLVAFWSNHLCVSAAAKLLVAPLAGSYEREAIRPHVLGRFADLVLASARHPAMLLYLDNAQSVGPSSRGAKLGGARAGRRGLNENYARELLELHTVGVNGGYSQNDVQELAKILTGWTADGLTARQAERPALDRLQRRVRPGRPMPLRQSNSGAIGFAFRELLHEPGSKTLLGVEYREAAVAEGEQAIQALCRRPSTANFVATKLVTHFVADAPPARAVERVSKVFRDSDGDLALVSRSLIELDDAWSGDLLKFRTPQDWLVAVLRALGEGKVTTALTDAAPGLLRQLRHPLWSPKAPAGFGDSMQEWADSDALLNRAELARNISGRLRGSVDPVRLLDVVDLRPGDPLRDLLSDTSIPADERLALAIAGPAFQWR